MTIQKHALMRRILEQLPPEERYLFSEHQIEALHRSALSLPKADHMVNIRWSIPFPGKGFYLVLFAGKERRSKQRLLAEKEFQMLPRILMAGVMLCGCAALFGLVYGQQMMYSARQRSEFNLDTPDNAVHPTVVPFKYDQEQCERSHRQWKDEQCVDYEHDYTF